MSTNTNRRLLEVGVLRPLCILLVVILHSFTIYWGKWSAPEGFVDCAPYKWIAATCFSFTMELFVLLSGYIFGYQMIVLKKEYSLMSLAKNKFYRLICPALIFGVIYALIFYWQRTPFNAVYSVLNGAGHLWFLPMLFWCFILGFGLHNSRISTKSKFVILLLAVLLSTISFPLRIDKTLYYLFFFYLGMILMGRQDICRKLSENNSFLFVTALVWIALFVSYELIVPDLSQQTSPVLKVLIKLLKKVWMFVYSCSGTLFWFMLAYRLMQKRTEVSKTIVWCSSISFGVYLFHQIITEVLYYKTSLPAIVGPYLLPWVGLAITLTGSVILVLLVRKLNLKFLGI